MDIYEYCMKHNINGMSRSELRQVLTQQHPHLQVKAITGRMLLLTPTDQVGKEQVKSHGRIIKCVMEYYNNPDEPIVLTSGNPFLNCDKIRKALGIDPMISRGDCRACHMNAMHRIEAGDIEYKN